MNLRDITCDRCEPELLPCPFCGKEADLYVEKFHDAVAYCPNCNITTEGINGIYKRRRAIETWNSRNPAAPQWTTETPTKEGRYAVYYKGWISMLNLKYKEGTKEGLFPDFPCPPLEEAFPYPESLWCKITLPPLPQGKESKE